MAHLERSTEQMKIQIPSSEVYLANILLEEVQTHSPNTKIQTLSDLFNTMATLAANAKESREPRYIPKSEEEKAYISTLMMIKIRPPNSVRNSKYTWEEYDSLRNTNKSFEIKETNIDIPALLEKATYTLKSKLR